jgi:hypothetical protein
MKRYEDGLKKNDFGTSKFERKMKRRSLNVEPEMFRSGIVSLSDDVFTVAWMALPFLLGQLGKRFLTKSLRLTS